MDATANLPQLYDDKTDIQTNPEIPDINKITAKDMNTIKELLKNAAYLDNEDIMNINNDIIFPKTNLVTNGQAVRTGRKIDGRDEYVKRFGFTEINQSAQTYSKSLGFQLSNFIITGYEFASKSTTNNWFYATDSNSASAWGIYFSLHGNNNSLELTTLNTNIKEAYVNVYYVEVANESNS